MNLLNVESNMVPIIPNYIENVNEGSNYHNFTLRAP